jgi:hypothetical protein
MSVFLHRWSNNLRNNPDIDVLLSISPESFPVGTDPNQSWYSGDYPLVWSNNKYNMVNYIFPIHFLTNDKLWKLIFLIPDFYGTYEISRSTKTWVSLIL